MKKIAIFTSDLRTFSGAARYVIDITNYLKKIDITVFAYDRPRKYHRINTNELKRLTKAKIVTYNNPEFPNRETLELTWSSMKALAQSKNFDVIYNINPSIILNLIHLLMFKLYHKKLILAAHSTRTLELEPNKQTFLSKLVWNVYMPIRNAIFMAIPNIHVLNTDDAERLKEWGYKHKIYYIPNFIDPKLIPKKFEVNKNKFVVLFVGRLLTIDKGIDILVNIINKTLAKSKKIQFHIAGNGEDGESLISNLVKKYPRNVKWLGFMNSNKLVKYYRRASIMISTSRSETFGLSVAEAQSNGLPVVAFDVSGIRDIIKKDYQGVLIPKFNADKFAEQVYDYYQKWCNKEISINLKKKISEETVKRYGSKRIFQLLEKMFMEP